MMFYRFLSVTAFIAAGFVGHLNAFTQSYTASFNLHLKNTKVFLLSFYGEKMSFIDSAFTSGNGEVNFILSNRRDPGIYRVSVNRQQFVDFIYNHENIKVDMDLSVPGVFPKAVQSGENDVFYSFLKYDMDYKKKINVLLVVGSEYPEQDRFYKTSLKEYQKLVRERNDKLNRIIAGSQGTFAARVLALYREPDLAWGLSEQQRREQLRQKYFDHFLLTDSLLIHTNLLTSKAIDYLSLYAGPNMSPSEIENQFIKGVDVILAQLEKTPVVYDFMISYLVGGFEKYKMEKVLVHLYETYLSGDRCAGEVREDELTRRLKAYEQLAEGKTAPELALRDSNNATVTLAAVNKEYFLLVFYASWCPHCHDLLTRLPELKQQMEHLKTAVITITLDTARSAWIDYLHNNMLPWINTFEGGGWNGPTIKAYNIYATPTMFLLDRQRKIIAKPITFSELKEEIKRLEK